jgi:hypothetical protein
VAAEGASPNKKAGIMHIVNGVELPLSVLRPLRLCVFARGSWVLVQPGWDEIKV